MQRSILKMTLASLMLITTIQPLAAQARGAMDGRGRGECKQKAELNLTEAQEQQMQSLRLSHEKEMIPLRAELETRQLAMQELRLAENSNKKKMYAQIDEISATKAKIAKAKLDHQLAVQELLTPEQRKLFKQNALHGRADRGNNGFRDDDRGPRHRMCRD